MKKKSLKVLAALGAVLALASCQGATETSESTGAVSSPTISTPDSTPDSTPSVPESTPSTPESTPSVPDSSVTEDSTDSSEEEVPLQSISLSASSTKISVGERATLTATLTPENATLTGIIMYEVADGEPTDIVSFEGNIITGLKSGTVKVQARNGSVVSAPLTITVTTGVARPENIQTVDNLHQYLLSLASKQLGSFKLVYNSTSAYSDNNATFIGKANQDEYLVTDAEGNAEDYYGIVDGTYYELSGLTSTYPQGSREKIVSEDEYNFSAGTIGDETARTTFNSYLNDLSISKWMKGGYVLGCDLYKGLNSAFPEHVTGASASEEEDKTKVSEYSAVDVQGFTVFTLNAYDDLSSDYMKTMISLSGTLDANDNLTKLTFTRTSYSSSQWDMEKHQPIDQSVNDNSITATFSDFSFVDELPASDPENPLFDTTGKWMTSCTPVLRTLDQSTWSYVENIVNVGDTIGTFTVAQDPDTYEPMCQPADALDSGSDLYMMAKEDGTPYEYFTYDEASGSYVADSDLPAGLNSVTEYVDVGNIFGEKLGEVQLTIQKNTAQPATLNGQIMDTNGAMIETTFNSSDNSWTVNTPVSVASYVNSGENPTFIFGINETGKVDYSNLSVSADQSMAIYGSWFRDPSESGMAFDFPCVIVELALGNGTGVVNLTISDGTSNIYMPISFSAAE